jgi:hypothetical protein
MIYRSEYGPRCPLRPRQPELGCRGPAAGDGRLLPLPQAVQFWLERLPFFCTDTKQPVPDEDGAE